LSEGRRVHEESRKKKRVEVIEKNLKGTKSHRIFFTPDLSHARIRLVPPLLP
jgi:hypothetical protein